MISLKSNIVLSAIFKCLEDCRGREGETADRSKRIGEQFAELQKEKRSTGTGKIGMVQ